MTAAAFKTWLLAHIDLDTWFTAETLQRRLAGISSRPEGFTEPPESFTAARILAAAVKLGLTEQHPCYPNEYCLPQWRAWMKKAKAAEDATPNGSQTIAHS